MIKVSDVIHIKGMDEKKRESLYELSKDKYVKAFLKEYHLPESSLNDYWIEFLDYRDDRKLCENCTGLKQCSKENKGIVIKAGTPEEIKKDTNTTNLRDAFFAMIGGGLNEE